MNGVLLCYSTRYWCSLLFGCRLHSHSHSHVLVAHWGPARWGFRACILRVWPESQGTRNNILSGILAVLPTVWLACSSWAREVARTCVLAFDALDHMFPSWARRVAQRCLLEFDALGHMPSWSDFICLFALTCALSRARLSLITTSMWVWTSCVLISSARTPSLIFWNLSSQPFIKSWMSFRVIGSSRVFRITSPLSLPYISSSSAGSTSATCDVWIGVVSPISLIFHLFYVLNFLKMILILVRNNPEDVTGLRHQLWYLSLSYGMNNEISKNNPLFTVVHQMTLTGRLAKSREDSVKRGLFTMWRIRHIMTRQRDEQSWHSMYNMNGRAADH